MAGTDDLVDFDVIESHKENIQALPSGRSAKALAQLYSPPLSGPSRSPSTPNDAKTRERAAFEKELLDIDDADDPLDLYDRYVKWTMDAYPSAQATPQSQLLPLLERATKAFQASPHYKNDPRYLKIWLHYIRLFSDAPREAFVFLARHNIGETLALYYEEYAAWLENAGRWSQAEEVFGLGLENEARPTERLLRKFGEFERRKEARPAQYDEPSSPAIPLARPALAAKIDPFSTASPSSQQLQQARSTTTKKSKNTKLQIFADGDETERPASDGSSKGWDNIGTITERRKENHIAARPMAGEKLKTGKTNGGIQKMMVFKDTSSKFHSLPKHISRSASHSAHAHQCVPNPKSGRLECVFVNLEAVYPRSSERSSEYCFEELRARHRGWIREESRKEANIFDMSSKSAATNAREVRANATESHEQKTGSQESASPSRQKQKSFKIFEDTIPEHGQLHDSSSEQALADSFSNKLVFNDENNENSAPVQRQADLARKARKEERANRTRKIKVMDVKHIKNETKTIQLNLDSPSKPKMKRKKSSDRPEPTMTINTKEAMDEIYDIFSQPFPSQTESVDDDDEEAEEEDSDDDCTTGDESTGTGKLSAPASDYGDETRNEILTAQKPMDQANDYPPDLTAWSDFTTNRRDRTQPLDDVNGSESAQSTSWELSQDQTSEDLHRQGELDGDLTTPQEENFRTLSIPLPNEDFEPLTTYGRNVGMLPNHRLPFMTPIAEQTESSLGTNTAHRQEDDYFGLKTPSRHGNALPPPSDNDELPSSPFQEVTTELADVKAKILQPIRTKSTKGTIALGHGTAKSQIAAKSKPVEMSEPVQKGPIITEQQCNPMDPQIRDTILSRIKPLLSSFDGYHQHTDADFGRTVEIRKWAKTVAKASRSSTNFEKTAQTLSVPPVLEFEGCETAYTLKRELGAGTFAPVYLVENSLAEAREVDDGDDGDNVRPDHGRLAHRRSLEAIKMEEPASAWEYYIINHSHRRLGVSRAADSIVRAHEMHLFRDECYLVEEYRDQGTLLDLVNMCRIESGNNGGMDEMLAMWLTVEMFRTVEALHARQIIHGDIKGDNVLVRFDDPGAESDWSPTYFSSGSHGWASKGVCLIDFGRGIDMKQFVPNVAFIADWKTSEADCAEMRELRPWTYQVDYHGLAGTVHSMLFGKYMETVGQKGSGLPGQGATKTYRIRESFKRYWQVDIWNEVFELMLNPLAHLEAEEGQKMPVLKGMRACRENMETWLEDNCERGVGLKATIARLEGVIRERRKKSKIAA